MILTIRIFLFSYVMNTKVFERRINTDTRDLEVCLKRLIKTLQVWCKNKLPFVFHSQYRLTMRDQSIHQTMKSIEWKCCPLWIRLYVFYVLANYSFRREIARISCPLFLNTDYMPLQARVMQWSRSSMLTRNNNCNLYHVNWSFILIMFTLFLYASYN